MDWNDVMPRVAVRPAGITELLALRAYLQGAKGKGKQRNKRLSEALRKVDEHLLAVAESLQFGPGS